MKKFTIFLLGLLLLIAPLARADEGMWLLTLLNKNYDDMKRQGFKLTPEDIYSVNKSSMKDAVVVFGGFCTGEIVSDRGLIFTNHHCGYGAIQQHSTVENDYLKYGFWAKEDKDEIPTPGLFVSFLQRLEDVTPQIQDAVKKMKKKDDKATVIKTTIEAIVKKATEGTGYNAEVKPYFFENQYFLLVYERFDDVRLVGTPPESIGKFGHDSDNWMYPRHTGDFSVFRVYASADGKPAKYDPANKPLKPKHFFPVSIQGVKEGDFSMILGYPGSTDRYITSGGVDELLDVEHPVRIKVRGIRQEIMMEDMMASDKVRIQYSSKYARSSNYWKYSIGQSQGLKRLKVRDKKLAIETEFQKWAAADKKRNEEFGGCVKMINDAYAGRKEFTFASQFLSESIFRGIEAVSFAYRAGANFDKADRLKMMGEMFFKDYNVSTDHKITAAMLKLFYSDVKPEFHPSFYVDVVKQYGTDFQKCSDDWFNNSIFTSKERYDAFVAAPDKAKLEADPIYIAAKSMYAKFEELDAKQKGFDQNLATGYNLFMKGLMLMSPERNYAPDANFTMRMTYGTVGSYAPKDAVKFNYITTLSGVMEKEIPNDYEFHVEPRLKELWLAKDFGQYAENGDVVVTFISNNDITGGNSGSPVINGNGELIGIAFDGNWEAMSGDVAFEPALQRTISVDIRYVLFIMDKFAGAQRLIDELKVVK